MGPWTRCFRAATATALVLGSAVFMVGCPSPGPETGESETQGTSDASTSGGSTDACWPDAGPSLSLGTVDIELHNATDEIVYVIAVAPDAGALDEWVAYHLYEPDGTEVPWTPTRCVDWCATEEVVCATQCVGRQEVAVPLMPGEVLQTQWSGHVRRTFEFPEGCEAADGCGAGRCVHPRPAEAGTYEVGIRVTSGCTDLDGAPCDCEVCVGLHEVDAPELIAILDYDGPATVTLEYSG